MDELNFGGRPFKKGAPKSLGVRRVQEWLCLHGFAVAIDNDFGDATEKAVKAFQRKHHLPATGIVDQKTHHALTQPMRNALKPIDPHGKTLRQLIVAYARQHIGQRPREIGGQNKGPWVRLYMDGHDGDPWLWCAGFATYPVKQAAETLGKAMPVLRNFGVANIAHHAQQVGDFLLLLLLPPSPAALPAPRSSREASSSNVVARPAICTVASSGRTTAPRWRPTRATRTRAVATTATRRSPAHAGSRTWTSRSSSSPPNEATTQVAANNVCDAKSRPSAALRARCIRRAGSSRGVESAAP